MRRSQIPETKTCRLTGDMLHLPGCTRIYEDEAADALARRVAFPPPVAGVGRRGAPGVVLKLQV